MPVAPQYNSRSGGKQLIVVAQTLCRLVNAAAPTIQGRYSNRPDLLALLAACQAVCGLLPAAMDEQIAMDAADQPTFNPADGVTVPGQTAP